MLASATTGLAKSVSVVAASEGPPRPPGRIAAGTAPAGRRGRRASESESPAERAGCRRQMTRLDGSGGSFEQQRLPARVAAL